MVNDIELSLLGVILTFAFSGAASLSFEPSVCPQWELLLTSTDQGGWNMSISELYVLGHPQSSEARLTQPWSKLLDWVAQLQVCGTLALAFASGTSRKRFEENHRSILDVIKQAGHHLFIDISPILGGHWRVELENLLQVTASGGVNSLVWEEYQDDAQHMADWVCIARSTSCYQILRD